MVVRFDHFTHIQCVYRRMVEVIHCNIDANNLFDFLHKVNILDVKIKSKPYNLFMSYRYLPDSPRWLLRHGRIEETRQILIEGGNKNKRRIPINLEDLLKSDFNTGYVCMKIFSF